MLIKEENLHTDVVSNIDFIHHGINCGYDPSELGNEVIELLSFFNLPELTPTVYTKFIVLKYKKFVIEVTKDKYLIKNNGLTTVLPKTVDFEFLLLCLNGYLYNER